MDWSDPDSVIEYLIAYMRVVAGGRRPFDEVVARGLVDTQRIYVFGWSNGAYMAALYGMWRANRIAAIAQYACSTPRAA